MSIRILLNSLSDDVRKEIGEKLEFKMEKSFYSQQQYGGNGNEDGNSIYAFDIRDDYIHLPLYFAVRVLKLSRPSRSSFRALDLTFNGSLRPLQKSVKKEAVKLLNKAGTCIISLYTGGGKTATSINMAIDIKLPTLIIATRLILIDQWALSIQKFCPAAKIQKIKSKKKIKEGCDFYIINAINMPKFPEGSFSHIGTVITDEMHLLGTEKLSASFQHVQPRYLIGLSATPYRPDGMDKLLHSYFGEKQVHRQLNRAHIAWKVETWKYIDVQLDIKMTNAGMLDWNAILNSQAASVERNQLIVAIIKLFPERCFLVLCKRIAHANTLEAMLNEEEIDVTSLVGLKRTFDTTARVLVATVQKAGVGFDHPKLNGLIIAADVEQYFIQYLGRVFRTEEGEPVIFDIVDKFATLKRHYTTRAGVYREHGGTIKNFFKEYPNLLK